MNLTRKLSPSTAPAQAAQLTTLPPAASLSIQRATAPRCRQAGTTKDPPEKAELERPNIRSLPTFARPGTRIEQYEIIRMLGRGGMGSVHLARDVRLGRRVAIKFLTDNRAHVTRYFLTEAQATARCRHPNIVVIHDMGEHDERPYIVLEYLEGKTLREWMREHGVTRAGSARAGAGHDGVRHDNARAALAPERAAELILPVVRALVHAHRAGIVHRDLKPANIIMGYDGTIKVLDFGIARLRASSVVDGDAGQSQTDLDDGKVVGTLAYMAPEQLEAGQIDHRADLWAVGVLLHELVVGERPIPTLSPGDLLDLCDLDVPMPSVREKRPDLGRLAGIIDRCLLKDRELRTANARLLLSELEAVCTHGKGQSKGRTLSPDSNPFAGLAAFQEDDHDRFFGRDADIAQVCERLRSQPLMAVVGPSGLGKSSLIRAGVIPTLRRSGDAWDVHITRPGRKPLQTLVDILGSLASTREVRENLLAGSSESAAQMRARLAAEPGYLGAVLRAHAKGTGRRALLFIDQFEEVFTLGTDAEQIRSYLSCLDGVADDASSPLRVIICLRSDFLDRLTPHRQFMARMSQGWMFLTALGPEQLREALVAPVSAAGHRFENPEIITDMLQQVARAPGTLPLMQFAAARLWTQRDRERRLLTMDSYRRMGGLAGTLASHAELVIAGMSQSELARAQVLFTRLVTPEQTRAVVDIDELGQLDEDSRAMTELIQQMVDVRLLAIQTHEQRPNTVELIHESLISAWPRLSRWLHENREDRAFLERLGAAAVAWRRGERSADLVWRGRAADETRLWRERYDGPLTDVESAYLDAVLALSVRQRRRIRVLTTAVIVFLCGIAAIGWWAKVESDRQAALVAQQNRDLAQQGKQLSASLSKNERMLAEVEAERDQSRQLYRERQDALAEASAALAEAEAARTAEEGARGRTEKSLGRVRRARRKLRSALSAAEQARNAAEDAERLAKVLAEQRQRDIQRLEDLIYRANDGRLPKRLTSESAGPSLKE